MARAEDIAPGLVIGLFILWVVLGQVIGYVWWTLVILWLVIRLVNKVSHVILKHQTNRRYS
jgi:hypothetical protein